MTEPENLTDLLHRATDQIEHPHLERQALYVASRRRARRRGVTAAVATAGLTAAVIVGARAADINHSGSNPATKSPTTSPTASETPRRPHTWRAWNPRDVDTLPAAPARVAPALPDSIDPPNASKPLADAPMQAAIAAVVRDGRIQVLSMGGDWRTAAENEQSALASLSPAGTRLVIVDGHVSTPGATVVDVSTGKSWNVAAPPGYRPYDGVAWTFVDERTLLLQDGDRAWLIDSRTGSAKAAPASIGGGTATAVDSNGGVLVSADWSQPNVLTDYNGASLRKVSMSRTGRLTSMQANDRVVAGTTYDERPLALVVADRATLTPATWLPIVDPDGLYANGALSTLALTQEGLVLLRVGGANGFHIVAWDPAADHLYLVSVVKTPLNINFAQRLLGD